MRGPLAIDFGNANTVIAIWRNGVAKTVQLRPFASLQEYGSEVIALVPSVIHFPEGKKETLIGEQVVAADLVDSPRTVRSFKAGLDYIHGISLGDRTIDYEEAGRFFVSTILKQCFQVFTGPEHPLVLTVPVDSFERYSKWLADICREHYCTNVRFIDEPSAAAISFGMQIQDGDTFLIFDFGASTLDLALVRFESGASSAKSGRYCEVLAKRAMRVGGDDLDAWLMLSCLDSFQSSKESLSAEQKAALMLRARSAKEALSSQASAKVLFPGNDSRARTITQKDFEDLLQEKDFFYKLTRTMDGVLNIAHDDHAIEKEGVKGVFMVGGSSLIPSVQNAVRSYFGRQRVHITQPLDAVARGAAAFAGGASLFDHIQHDYAVYYLDPKSNEPAIDTIVKRGTKYPTDKPVAVRTITATEYNQTEFEMLICEVSTEPVAETTDKQERAENIYSRNLERLVRFEFLNKANPCLLKTERPVQKGQRALEIAFHIDENKMLVMDSWIFKGTKKVPHLTMMPVSRLL